MYVALTSLHYCFFVNPIKLSLTTLRFTDRKGIKFVYFLYVENFIYINGRQKIEYKYKEVIISNELINGLFTILE